MHPGNTKNRITHNFHEVATAKSKKNRGEIDPENLLVEVLNKESGMKKETKDVILENFKNAMKENSCHEGQKHLCFGHIMRILAETLNFVYHHDPNKG